MACAGWLVAALQAPAQLDQRRPGALQALEHEGGAPVDRRGDLGHVGHVVEGRAPPIRTGVVERSGASRFAVLHEAEHRPPRRRQQEGFDVLDVEEVAEVQADWPVRAAGAPSGVRRRRPRPYHQVGE